MASYCRGKRAFLIIALLAAAGCASGQTLGGPAGALLNSRNPWMGGVMSAGTDIVAGATITEISARGAREAAESGRPVEYRTANGRGVYHAEPLAEKTRSRCTRVEEKVSADGRVVMEGVKEVCESAKKPGN